MGPWHRSMLPSVRRSSPPPPVAGPQEVRGLDKHTQKRAHSSSAGHTRFLSPSPGDLMERLEGRQRELARLTRFTPSPAAIAASRLPPSIDPDSAQAEMLEFGSDHLEDKPRQLATRKPAQVAELATSPTDSPICEHCGRGPQTQTDSANTKWRKRQDVVALRKRVRDLERAAQVATVAAEYDRKQHHLTLVEAKKEVDEARAAQLIAEDRLRAEEQACSALRAALAKAHADKERCLMAVSPYSKGAETVQLQAINDELLAQEALKGQAKEVAALQQVVLAKKEIVSLQYDLAKARADPATSPTSCSEKAARRPTPLYQELEQNFSQKWKTCGKPWPACGDCKQCLEGGSLDQTIMAAQEFKTVDPEQRYAHMDVDDLVAARVYTRETPKYKAPGGDEDLPIYQIVNCVCRDMLEPDRPPRQFASMYYHLKNAVTHLPGAAVGEPLFREAASYYELLGKTLDHLRHKLNNTTFC